MENLIYFQENAKKCCCYLTKPKIGVILDYAMLKTIDSFCLKNRLLTPNKTIIVGLSGGPDSVFLLHFLHTVQQKYNLTLVAAHLNHGWRPEADHDEQFCKELADSLAIPFISAHAKDIQVVRKHTGSQEDLGRQLRRIFFARTAQEHNTTIIALAHHQDDLVETFFIRLLRGAGVTGLASIRTQQGNYIRPLLCVTKQEILDYLHTDNISYCTDLTNEHDTYLRNRIRKYLIPATTACDERAPKTIINTIEQLQATDDFLETLTHATYVRIAPNNILDLTEFSMLHTFLQKRIILTWLCAYKVPFNPSDALFNEIKRFMLNGTTKEHTISNWHIVKNRTTATIIQK